MIAHKELEQEEHTTFAFVFDSAERKSALN